MTALPQHESQRQHISQRQLRNDSAVVLRAVERGATFVITNNGRPVAEIRPIQQDPFDGIRVQSAVPGARFAGLNPVQVDCEESALDALLLLRGDR